MHWFLPDGRALFSYDVLGLTRLDIAKGKLTHNDKVGGRHFAPNGDVAILLEKKKGEFKVFDLSGSAPKVVGKSSFYSPEVGILADGTRYVEIFGGKVFVRALETYKEQSSTTYSASPLGALALGPRLDPFVKRHRLFVGPDDAIAMFGLDGLLVGGRLNPAGVLENAWSLTCGVPQGRVHALPHASATFVTAYHPALGRAYCAIIREGSVVTREITAIGPVTWSGKAFVFQSDPATIVREDLAGARETFSIPEGSHGPGEVMASGDAIYFVPENHSAIIDVIAAKRFDRGDDFAPDPLRDTRTMNALGRVANQHFEFDWGAGTRFYLASDEGDGGFLRIALASWLDRNQTTASRSVEVRPVDVDELARDFGILDEGNIHLLPAIAALPTYYDAAYGGMARRSERIDDPKPILKREAARVLLCAAVEQFASETRIPLAQNVSRWSADSSSAAELAARLDPQQFLREDLGKWSGDIAQSVFWLAFDVYGPASVAVLTDWLVKRPNESMIENPHVYTDRVKRLLAQFPETKSPFVEALASGRGTHPPEYLDELASAVDEVAS